jgi:hypothetical protein
MLLFKPLLPPFSELLILVQQLLSLLAGIWLGPLHGEIRGWLWTWESIDHDFLLLLCFLRLFWLLMSRPLTPRLLSLGWLRRWRLRLSLALMGLGLWLPKLRCV